MGWPYRFVNLSPEQISDRRRLLDLYGFYAWLSPIFLFSFLHIVQLLLARYPRSFTRRPFSKSPTFFQRNTRRLLWILDTPLPSDFGTLKVHLIGLLYTNWLIFLTIHQTGTDYMHLTKRLGHIAVSQLPLQYLLSVKSPLSPIQFVTGLTHETLNPYHRLSGRITHIFLLSHAILYLNFFFAISALPRRLYDRDVQLGILAITILTILSATARPIIRKKAYHKSFYVPHALLSFILIPAISAHVPYTRRYVFQVFALYLFNVITRKFNTTPPSSFATITPMDETNGALLHISIPAPKTPFGSPIPTWIPGQHVYLKSGHNPKFPRSPFTIASVPPILPNAADTEKVYRGYALPPMELIVRKLGGPTTAWLAGTRASASNDSDGKHVKTSGNVKDPAYPSFPATPQKTSKIDVLVEGPYGSSSSIVPALFSSISEATPENESQEGKGEDEEILLIGGGVGATYTLPIYVSLVTAQAQVQVKAEAETQSRRLAKRTERNGVDREEKEEQDEEKVEETNTTSPLSRRVRMQFHWIVRSQAEAEWGIEYLRKAITKTQHLNPAKPELLLNVKIHITSQASKEANRSSVHQVPTPPEDFTAINKEKMLTPSTSDDDMSKTSPVSPPAGIEVLNPGMRPNLCSLIDSVFSPHLPSQHNPNPASQRQKSSEPRPLHSRITVLICAPPSLTNAVRREVGRHVLQYGRDVVWHEETFGMGV
jgi:Ferric reductase like transmembrane component/Ferric reductase NAD binding domain